MVFIDRDVETRQFGYKIISNNDGAQRILFEEYGWSTPGEVLSHLEELKKAINEGVKSAFTGG